MLFYTSLTSCCSWFVFSFLFFFFSSRRRHTRCLSDWSSDVCSSDLSCGGLFKDAFVNVVRDLVAQILLHFRFDSLFVERVDLSGINAVPPEKLAMTLIKLPKRSICPLSIDAEQRREFQAVGERIIPRCPSRAISGSRRNAQI